MLAPTRRNTVLTPLLNCRLRAGNIPALSRQFNKHVEGAVTTMFIQKDAGKSKVRLGNPIPLRSTLQTQRRRERGSPT
jgi:hypothetical protein